MFSKQEASQLRKEFWTVFGNYMKPVPGAGEEKISWINYKTGIKHIRFKMDAGSKSAIISIEISHTNSVEQSKVFNHFLLLQQYLHEMLGEEWKWVGAVAEEGKWVSRIYKELKGVNVFDKATWPEIISFLKPRIMALDAFWTNARDGFE